MPCNGKCCEDFTLVVDGGPVTHSEWSAGGWVYGDLATLAFPSTEETRFNCRNFDPVTRLCRDYANRPATCREFPRGVVHEGATTDVCWHCGETKETLIEDQPKPEVEKPRIVAASANHASLRIAHHTFCNGSGLYNVARSLCEAEKELGLDSVLIASENEAEWEKALDADVHVGHTCLPRLFHGKSFLKQLTKPFRLVHVGHGTPEHIVEGSIQASEGGQYAPGDSLMIMLNDLRRAHARVTFWPRHKWLLDRFMATGTEMKLVKLGVPKAFWADGPSRGKYAGTPSVLSIENAHFIKMPLSLAFMWPYVAEEVDGAIAHLCYVPLNQARAWYPLVNANGAHFHAHVGPWTFGHDELRRVFKGFDFLYSGVRFGDFNLTCLEALAAGLKVISYKGNPYSHFWIEEGDTRIQCEQLIEVLKGNVEARADREEVPDISETALQMQDIYQEIVPEHWAGKKVELQAVA